MADSMVPILVPSVGESVTEGTISRWYVKDGAAVRPGDKLFELETDKATQDVPTITGGVVHLLVPEGAKVAIGQKVADLEPGAVPKAAPVAVAAPAAYGPHQSPAVKRVLGESGVDPATIEGTGPGGRITKADAVAASSPPQPPPAPVVLPEAPPVAAPKRAASARGEAREKMSGLRQKIAQRLVEAQQTAAILTTFNEADLSAIVALRAKYKDAFKAKHGVGLGFMSFFVKACVEGLKTYPRVNGRIEGTEMVLPEYYDVGVAVSTEKGLMVPVLRDADQKSFAAIEKEIVGYATKARDGKIEVSDLQGGTFTITNGGTFGSLLSTPILNPPQSGILGMHAIKDRPVVVEGQIVVRPMMYLALSYDHRIVDGREAVGFLVKVKDLVEAPERAFLDV